MGASITNKINTNTKEKQWRSVTVYKSIKSNTYDEYINFIKKTTSLNDDILNEKWNNLYINVNNKTFEESKIVLENFVKFIRKNKKQIN